jgi:hypothetical protein
VILGANYPWLNYGWDFGLPPAAWTGGRSAQEFRAAQWRTIAADLRHAADLGLSVVRWFILGDGAGAPAAPYHSGVQPLLEDFSAVLGLCAEARVQLLPSLIDYRWCLPPAGAAGGVIQGGRALAIQNPRQRDLFLDRIFEPLLDVSRRRQDAIYAWEAMNEPEWAARAPRWRFWDGRRSAIRAFLREAVRRINASGFVSTIGWAHWRTIRAWKTEDWGVGLQQIHYYAQGGAELPPARSVCDGPCLAGEFATSPDEPWPDGARTLEQRVRRLRDAGYAGALLWSLRARDSATRWTPAEQAQIARIAGRPFPAA